MTVDINLLSELYELAGAQCEGMLGLEHAARLEELVLGDDALRWRYVLYTQFHARAERAGQEVRTGRWKSEQPPSLGQPTAQRPLMYHGLPADVRSQIGWGTSAPSRPSLPLDALSRSPGLFCLSSTLFSYVMAALILGSLVLGTRVWRGRGEREVAPAAGLAAAAVPDGGLQGTIVARIIGAKDCRWADPRTAATVGQAVAVGRKFALASGKLEIAYNIGDRVALEGPATFEVDSLHSGRLSAGKLTFRSITVGLDGPLNDLPAKGYTRPPIFSKPQFSVRGPRVIVGDLCAEFILSIDPSGTSNTRLLSGTIDLRYPHGVRPGDSISGTCWWRAQGDVTHYFRAVCQAGEMPMSLQIQMAGAQRNKSGKFVWSGESPSTDRTRGNKSIGNDRVRP